MNMQATRKILLFTMAAFLLCCNRANNERFFIYYDKPFECLQMKAAIKNKPFVIVLIDSTQDASRRYLQQLLTTYKHLTKNAIYNIVDISNKDNQWYIKWLLPASLPLTCVFSPTGKLIDLIPGTSRESFLYTEEAIKNMEATVFHWPNRFGMNKKEVIPLLGKLLEEKHFLSVGGHSPTALKALVKALPYPFSMYLKLKGEMMIQNTVGAKRIAEALIKIETPYFLELYREEFITARKIINPDFDINTEANIRVDKTIIILDNSIVDESVPVNITVYNDGERPLRISRVYLSCTCLELLGDSRNIVIEAKSSHVFNIYFTPDNEGEISRNVFIASNAINMPILHIQIQANTISNINNNN